MNNIRRTVARAWAIAAVSLLMGGFAVAPTFASQGLHSRLVAETNTEYGFTMLRPAGWSRVDLGDQEGFRPDTAATGPNRVLLAATNLKTVADAQGVGSQVITYLLYQQSPSLAGWTSRVEASWRSLGVRSFVRLSQLRTASVYYVQASPSEADLIAFSTAGGQPVETTLYAFGTFARLSSLRSSGMLAQFDLIAASLSARSGASLLPAVTTSAPTGLMAPAAGPYHSDSGTKQDGPEFLYRMQTDYYQAPPEIYWMYDYLHYLLHAQTNVYMYRADLTDYWSLDCANQNPPEIYQHLINKVTTPANGVITDSFYPAKIVAHLNPTTAHVEVAGNAGLAYCEHYFPFTH